ncbi:MAG: bifunctional phosphopantothenoylcysteine decarboxylase/phosphopantothenate--cysteine ligase CoaBC [Actinobacteria bacterium]|nr:bifunctional phosphopantothenoylcysteine decarboxylase/phosphopantothenate--cysteine ligase CoaBC [Actinomycetota bacterium]
MINFPRGREVILGVGAGIAAYKSCDLLRRLIDVGHSTTVIPTSSSINFVGRTTWEALSGKPAPSELWDSNEGVAHVDAAKRAELIVVAPATADLIARIATGRADDLLTSTILATTAPILIVPAMHPEMYLNPATQSNIALLRERGLSVMEPAIGKLTSGDEGIGRFPETSIILKEINQLISSRQKLRNKKIVVTAGGTIEAIDPVRYIGNRSSGRQGLEIAYRARSEGACVTVIAANTEEFNLPGVKRINVGSAREMQNAMKSELDTADALIMSAAVVDAKPAARSEEKISKENLVEITLERNPDLLAEAAQQKRPNQVFVGFAAETEGNLLERGLRKLHSKGVDYLYVTDVSGGRVFGEETTTGILLSKRGVSWNFLEAPKVEVASYIVDRLAEDFVELGSGNE